MTESSATRIDARRTLMNALFGTMITQVVGVTARLGLADAIGNDGRSADDLAEQFDIDPERLNRLLRALACLGLCTEPKQGTFLLTEAGALLREDNPQSLLSLARLLTDKSMQDAWLHLETGIRTGRPAFTEVFGVPVFEYMADRPELSAVFNAAMSQRTKGDGVATALPEHYDFTTFASVTDVGGGDGTLLASVLEHHPALRGVVFDTPEGVAQAARTLDAAGLAGRCEVVAGDFFDSVPSGSDLHLIKSVMHNWDDDQAVRILTRCREALPDHGRLLIVEPVLPDTVDPNGDAREDPYLSDLNMLVLVGGKERTQADFEKLCARAGFEVTRVVELPPHVDFSAIEAKPA
ncbi:methyltransferase [Actinosynnema sp. NPDC023587]|uniref:methyltransferase n=1 Tax=Actinosynnema sp. NPDC023587 TaxID=3154695 RepID=UPI0033F59F60